MCKDREKNKGGRQVDYYKSSQWILFFFIYCFLGWIWESCLVSAKSKQWVNRGFLHGPFLPIYGSGAMAILVMTLPVREDLFCVFAFGLVGATFLEYITGVCMESLFHVRYWDYSQKLFNIKGHICLEASLAWGIFSVLLVKCIHVEVEKIVFKLPIMAVEMGAVLLTIGSIVDFIQSFNEAMDLKGMLGQLTESSQKILQLQRRFERLVTTVEEEYGLYRMEREALKEQKKKVHTRKVILEQVMALYKQKRKEELYALKKQIEKLISGHKVNYEEAEHYKKQLKEVSRFWEQKSDEAYLRAMRLLSRNPGAVSHQYNKVLQEIKDIMSHKVREKSHKK